jgi:hypothetical protein
MAKKRSEPTVEECYLRAAEARRIADGAADPITKAEFLEIEQRWLSLARSSGIEKQRGL